MNKIIRFIGIFVVTCVALSSCAKEPKENIAAKKEKAFEEWMKLYGDGAVKHSSGIYIKKIHSDSSGVIKPPKDREWVRINYTSRVLNTGNIFTLRDSLTARYQGTFQYYTHYVPQFLQFVQPDGSNVSNSRMILGVYNALRTMNAGDSVRVYIPMSQGYIWNTSFTSGYQGQTSTIASDTPIIVDLGLREIVSDPKTAEVETVQRFAFDRWHQTLDDTIKANIFRRSISVGRDTMHVKKDTTASIYYVGRFLDGFVFDTNIKDTAVKYHIYKSSNRYDSINVSLGSTDTTYVRGFYTAITGMRFGEIAQTVFPSSYGYGATLMSQENKTWIEPYSPLLFTIHVLPRNGDGTSRHPYTIAGVKSLKAPEDSVWIIGYVVGAVDGPSVQHNAVYSDTVKVWTNILLSDIRTPTEASKVIAIELPAGPIRDALNLPDNKAKVYRKRIAFKGNLEEYLGQMGMVDVKQYIKK